MSHRILVFAPSFERFDQRGEDLARTKMTEIKCADSLSGLLQLCPYGSVQNRTKLKANKKRIARLRSHEESVNSQLPNGF